MILPMKVDFIWQGINIWAMTCDFQQCGSFEGEDTEQPTYLLTVIRDLNFSSMDCMASTDGWCD